MLIVYDFSEASRKPLHRAIAIARHFEAKLHVAYVVSSKTTSHLPWSVAHKIVCGASCPVMTMKPRRANLQSHNNHGNNSRSKTATVVAASDSQTRSIHSFSVAKTGAKNA